ncbi:hypothetical protein DP116_19460 [Brasilonema bromeliae SPC951]|uniref:Uncharacterized protein n=1 Tax=Brasilonema bromeliae SPC951 TaxID=385972 RepID=A0ABX1PAN0_9CYAN|nr:hypothetical protein [Brasilonema bromeliae SPC951]
MPLRDSHFPKCNTEIWMRWEYQVALVISDPFSTIIGLYYQHYENLIFLDFIFRNKHLLEDTQYGDF